MKDNKDNSYSDECQKDHQNEYTTEIPDTDLDSQLAD